MEDGAAHETPHCQADQGGQQTGVETPVQVCRCAGVQETVSESTTCDETTSTTHFPVPFGPIFRIFFLKFFFTFFFFALGYFLTVRDPPYGEKFKKIFPNVVFDSLN